MSIQRNIWLTRIVGVLLAGALLSAAPASGQEANEEAMVKFNFVESVSLAHLVEYVSERTGARFIYDEGLTGDVVIRSPLEVKAASLLPLLKSILEFKGYGLVEEEGWYKIRKGTRTEVVQREAPAEVFVSGRLPEEIRPDAVYTLLMDLQYADADEFSNTVKTAVGLSPVKVPGTRTLIFTDYGSRIELAAAMAGLLDRPGRAVAPGTYAFRHVQAMQVKEMALALLRAQLVPDLAMGEADVKGPALFVDQAANRVILLVPAEKVDECLAVLKTLDAEGQAELKAYEVRRTEAGQAMAFIKEAVRARAPGLTDVIVEQAGEGRILVVGPPPAQEIAADALRMLEERGELTVKYYVIRHVQAARIETLGRALLGVVEGGAGEREMLMVAPQENTLIARLTEEQHQGLADIIERFDTPQEAVRATQMRFYQIRNTDAVELAERLRSVLGAAGGELGLGGKSAADLLLERSQYLGVKRTDQELLPLLAPAPEAPEPAPAAPETEGKAEGGAQPAEAPEAEVRVVADENTNTIVVQAPVEYHETIGKLVEYLDRRRPQVLIEAVIASVSASSDLAVAVELMYSGDTAGTRALVFSSFGLSTVNVGAGTRTLVPAEGLNASILDPDGWNAVIRALRSDSRSRVIAEPKILVNDNASGRFESVQEEPFTSVNMGQTISTTSFAGYAEAGLTITVTPRIMEGNFVHLDYTITSRDFAGTSALPGVPPSRTGDAIASSVTVPDGHTAVMGGLTRERRSEAEHGIPILSRLPLIGRLFRSAAKGTGGSRLFVFLRPVILRDEDFADLKRLSRADLMDSTGPAWGPEGIYPPVEPRVMR